MSRPLAIRLLGAPAVLAHGAVLELPASRAIPLLALLALSPDRVPRERIAALLWRRVALASALASLRQLLHHLPEPLRGAVASDRAALALDREHVDCDLWNLRVGLAPGVAARDVLPLYPEPLLGAARFDDFPEFDDWLRLERSRLAQDVRAAVDRQVTGLPDEAALELMQRWLRRDPSDEAMHARAIARLVAAGRTHEAEAQYEALRHRLATAEGRAPQPATRAPLEAAARREGVPRGTLPAVATSFFGRQDELAELARLAADPHCRLITLHGPGGVGKTRLAMAFAEETARHPEDVWYVSLEAAPSSQAMYAAIASAMRIEVSPRQEPRVALVGALRTQRGFLVLDNFEQLLPVRGDAPQEAATFVAELLRTAAALKVLVTSRVRLNLQEEWLVDVSGLPYPDASSENGLHDAGVELFASRARQAYRGFSTSAERPHILAICRAADGLPLALELAAAQVGTRPCAEIAQDLLAPAGTSRALNRPDRQASVLRVIEHSLAAASPAQALSFERLALFQGAFDAAQAFAVGRVSEGELRELAGRALLSRQGDAFRMHPLLRQVAERRLRRRRTAARHVEAAFVSECARRTGAALARLWRRPTSIAARAELGQAREDDLKALGFAVAQGDEEGAWTIASALVDFGIVTGLVRATLDAWPDPSVPGLSARMQAMVLLRRADLRRHCGLYAEAFADLDAAARLDGEPRLRFALHVARAGLHVFRGSFEDCLAEARAALVHVEAVGDEAPLVRLLSQYGTALMELGDLDRAREVLEESMARAEAMDASAALLVYPLNALGGLEDYSGDARACAAIHRRALAMLEADGLTRMQAPHWCNLGGALLVLEDFAAALPAFERGIAIAAQVGDLGPLTYSQVGMGHALSGLERFTEADRVGAEAQANARKLESTALHSEATTVRVRAALDSGDPEAARRIVLEYEAGVAERDAGFRGVDEVFNLARVARDLRLPGHEAPVCAAVTALLAHPGCLDTQRPRLQAWREAEGLPAVAPGDPREAAQRLVALLSG